MIKLVIPFFLSFFFSFLSAFAQYETLGNSKVKHVNGYIFYSLNYDSSLKRYLQKERYFIENLKDTFSIIGKKNLHAIREKYPKFRKGLFRTHSEKFHFTMYDFYTFSHDSLIGLDYLQGEFYEDVTGHLFLVGKISIKALVFYNPQDNVFKLIYGNYYNTPPFMYMIKSKRKLQKVNEYDLNKLGLKISNSNKIPFDI
jgi:hypothetical protein